MEHSSQDNGQSGEAIGMVDRVKESAAVQLNSQKTRATDTLGSVAAAIRQSSEPLRANQQEMLANYVAKAADQLDQLSAHMRDRDWSELMDDARQFARRQPALFVGAAFAVGAVAARFLKSSPNAQRSLKSTAGRDYAGATRYPGGL